MKIEFWLIGLIAIFAFIFVRSLRSGSTFLVERYTNRDKTKHGPRGFGRTGEKRIERKRRAFGAPNS